MAARAFVMTLDTRQQDALSAKLTPAAIEQLLNRAAKAGAVAGVGVLRPAAPRGSQKRLSQYYRRMHLSHGTFRRTVQGKAIKRRDWDLSHFTVGYVLGPMGDNAFTRAWIEYGTAPHDQRFKGAKKNFGRGRGQHPGERATFWMQRSAPRAFAAATAASDQILGRYPDG